MIPSKSDHDVADGVNGVDAYYYAAKTLMMTLF